MVYACLESLRRLLRSYGWGTRPRTMQLLAGGAIAAHEDP